MSVCTCGKLIVGKTNFPYRRHELQLLLLCLYGHLYVAAGGGPESGFEPGR